MRTITSIFALIVLMTLAASASADYTVESGPDHVLITMSTGDLGDEIQANDIENLLKGGINLWFIEDGTVVTALLPSEY